MLYILIPITKTSSTCSNPPIHSVNEAFNFQIPCVVSDNCGCSKDLLFEGINGYTYKTGNIEELSYKMNMALNSNKNDFNFDIINQFSIKINVKNIFNKLN